MHFYQPPTTQSYNEHYDIYGMGAIFHHMLLGYPPRAKPVKSIPKLSYRIEKLLDAMLADNPQERPQSAQQVLVELKRIAAKNIPKKRSKIGKEITKKTTSTHQNKTKKPKQNIPKNPLNLWLLVALILSLGVIATLLIKDFLL